jgi:hypothetical protein
MSAYVDRPEFARAMAAITTGEGVSAPLTSFFDTVEAEWGVRPVWAETAFIEPHRLPRLMVWVRTETEALVFREGGIPYANHDPKMQRRLMELYFASQRSQRSWSSRLFSSASMSPPARMFAVVNDVEGPARATAHRAVPDDEVDEWAQSLGLGEQFWCWQRLFGPPVVFVHTAQQAAHLRESRATAAWAESWGEIVARYDTLGFTVAGAATVYVDSKERFDGYFKSSWANFWR